MPLDDSILIRISKELKEKMRKFDNINWSSWIRTQVGDKIKELEEIERLSAFNFCSQCGNRLISPGDRFCSKCGNPVPE